MISRTAAILSKQLAQGDDMYQLRPFQARDLFIAGFLCCSALATATASENSEVLFTVPLGEGGIRYSGLAPEQRPWGPSTLKVDDAGTFWIADSAAQRLLRFDEAGNVLEVVELGKHAHAIADFAVTPEEIIALDNSGNQPRLLWVTNDWRNRVLDGRTVSVPSAGVTGIRSSDSADILLEMEGGGHYFRVTPKASNAKVLEVTADDSFRALRFSSTPHKLVIESSVGTRIESFRHTLARAVELGSDRDGNLYLLIEQVSSDAVLHVDWLIYKLSPDLELLGVARFPLADQFIHVEHPLAISPSGDVFGLVTRPSAIDVIRLTFSSAVEDILPSGGVLPQEAAITSTSPALGCRSRTEMENSALAYLNNRTLLSKENISGKCAGRIAPRHLRREYSSVPYKWGGTDSAASFNKAMAAGKRAGDIPQSRGDAVEGCASGVDCSAFVSNAWGIPREYTSTLPGYSIQVSGPPEELKPGDIVNRKDDHAAMVATPPDAAGAYFYESTVGENADRVVYQYHSWAYFSKYTRLRYKNVCDEPSPPPPPQLPGEFTVSIASACVSKAPNVTLTWNTSERAKTYTVLRDSIILQPGVTVTTLTDKNVAAGHAYSYRVRAENDAGGTESNPVTVLVPEDVCGARSPLISSVSPNPVTGSPVLQRLDIIGSRFRQPSKVRLRDVTSGIVLPDQAPRPFSATQLAVYAVFTPSAHTWSVEVINPDGETSGQHLFQVVGPDIVVPAIPVNPSPGSDSSPGPTMSSASVTLSWSASSGATSYSLGVRDMITNQLVVDTTTSGAFYTASLSAGKPYRWNVAACNSAGCSSFTTPLYFQTLGSAPVPVPAMPASPSPGSTSSPGPTMSNSSVTLSWSASSGATSYSFGVRDMITNQLVVDTTTNGTSYTTGLSASKPYRWNVAACNSAGCSSFTTALYFQTPSSGPVPVPSMPTNPSPGSSSSPGPTMASSSVTFSWSASSGATIYSFGVRDMITNQLVVDTTTNGTSYTAGLSASKPYRWNVAACNSAGCSSFTTALYFQTPGSGPVPVPSMPTNPSPGSSSSPGPTMASSSVTFSWSASSGATIYSFGVRDMITNQLVVDTTTSGTSYTAGLSASKPYRWNVAACNSAGCSSFTTPLYFQTPGSGPVPVPSMPTNPSPGSTSSPGPTMSNSSVTLSWSASSGATSYSFGVRDMITNQLVVDTTTSGTSYTAGLSASKPYRWNVAACNSAGCSSFTAPLYFQTPGSVPVPAMPTNPSPGSTSSPGPTMSSSNVTLSWSASSGATSYSFGVRDMITNQLVVDTTTSGTSYSAGLSAGKPYRWNVAACNSAGCSSFTTPLYFQTPGSVPSTPNSPSPGSTSSPGPTMSSSNVTLSWSASSGATFYDLGVRDMSTNQLVVDTTTSSTSYSANLSAGKPYRWNVAACNSAGCSSFATSLYFQTPGSVPTTPNNPSPGSTSSPGPTMSSSSVTLSWSASSGATYYDLGIRDMSTNQLVVDTTTSSTSYTAGLSAGKPYRWNVAACNSAGCSSFTTSLYFQTPGGVTVPSVPSNTNPGSTSSPGSTTSSSTVTLSWSASSGATYYDLGVRDMITNQLVVDTTTTGTSYTVSLSAGRQYRWNVAACNSAGCSAFTTPKYFKTP
jgi:hypothetical protein